MLALNKEIKMSFFLLYASHQYSQLISCSFIFFAQITENVNIVNFTLQFSHLTFSFAFVLLRHLYSQFFFTCWVFFEFLFCGQLEIGWDDLDWIVNNEILVFKAFALRILFKNLKLRKNFFRCQNFNQSVFKN